jgi:hypothetical protein
MRRRGPMRIGLPGLALASHHSALGCARLRRRLTGWPVSAALAFIRFQRSLA